MTTLNTDIHTDTKMKCPKCDSKETIKMGTTHGVVPKRRWFCKEGQHFFVAPIEK